MSIKDFAPVVMQSPQPRKGAGDIWTVSAPWTSPAFRYGGAWWRVRISAGYQTDGATIPRIAWSIVGSPMSMPVLPCALVHDALYSAELVPAHADADWIFLGLLQRADVGWVKRNAIWTAVRTFGGIVWDRHTAKSVLESRRLCEMVRANAR
jgi:hypothetical protein